MNSKLKKTTTGALLLAIGVLLPQVFHLVGGSPAGAIFLPMHLPVLIGGFILGPVYGLFLGGVLPVLSFILTGMPPMVPIPRMIFMMFELAAYGFFAGLFYKKMSLYLYISLFFSQLAGRLAFAGGILITSYILQLKVPVILTVVGAIGTGLPGIVLQFIIIGPIILALKKGGFINDYNRKLKNRAK